MWIRDAPNVKKDVFVAERDFIVANGVGTVSPFLLGAKKDFFNSEIVSPVFYLWKVHPEHPIKIVSNSPGNISVYPDVPEDDTRSPEDVYSSSIEYDCSKFVLVPFDVDSKNVSCEKWVFKGGFPRVGRDSLDAFLIYFSKNSSGVHPQDKLLFANTMPSQVGNNFLHWLTQGGEFSYHLRKSSNRLEGKFNISYDELARVYADISNVLKDRYEDPVDFR